MKKRTKENLFIAATLIALLLSYFGMLAIAREFGYSTVGIFSGPNIVAALITFSLGATMAATMD